MPTNGDIYTDANGIQHGPLGTTGGYLIEYWNKQGHHLLPEYTSYSWIRDLPINQEGAKEYMENLQKLNRSKTAIITGVTGQDGSFLTELLLEKGYQVIGVKRRTATNNTENLSSIIGNANFQLVEGDVTDPHSMSGLIAQYKPGEFYNLAAQSHVGTSFKQPSYTFQVNAVGVLNILEAIRVHSPTTKLYQASTSEMLGSNFNIDVEGIKYQDESTPFCANSPYAAAKLASHNLIQLYRNGYGLFCCAGILHNHESERRGENFVTRKITKYVAYLRNTIEQQGISSYDMDVCGLYKYHPKLKLGNIDAVRDWGYAPDYVEAMWLMLQQDNPQDFMIATGEGHTVKEFLQEAFTCSDDKFEMFDWELYVEIDPELYRPCEVDYLQGRADKAKKVLGWQPRTKFKQLVEKMVQHDIQETQKNNQTTTSSQTNPNHSSK